MNVAIIGCSGMGRVHADALTKAGLRVALCVDTVRANAEALAKAYGAKVAASAAKAMTAKDIDAVLIATPTPFHLEYILKAAKAGKHIFCEKPFCRTEAECKEAIAAAKKAGVKLFVGHVVRYFHEFEAMKAQVESGKIGKPGFVKISRGGIFPGGPKSWFANYKMSGGVTLDCMIHDLDWVRYVFGEPVRIYGKALMRSGKEPMDYSQVTMRLKSGLIATIIGTWAHPAGFRVQAEICGDGGMVQYDSADAPMSSMKRETGSGPSMIVPASPVSESPYQREWEDFAAWVRDDRAPRVTPEDGMIAVRMAEAALESSATGKPVRL
ncbi:MAG: gfo/Idh/MocA family oxidoreductase [Candidatus Hydrogenedens sp.]|nr:gfo/Idh/MocA family oxidoreductase [Candidatus Hydrogenedens sp.]